LEILVLNNNPKLNLIPKEINKLEKLKVFGIANTSVLRLPSAIADIKTLKEVYVQNTPMIVPSYQMAMRGVAAIKEYFKTDEPDKVSKAEENITNQSLHEEKEE